MQRFSVTVHRKLMVPSELGANEMPLPSDIVLTPQRWSDTARWHFDTATIEATGPVESLRQCLSLLAQWVIIHNEFGTVVYAGQIHEIELSDGGMKITVNLDDVANRIRVKYTTETPTGGTESGVTGWADDALSQQRYGVREIEVSLPDTAQINAEAMRARALAMMAWPAPVVKSGNVSAPSCTFQCRSHFEALSKLYYVNMNGQVEYVKTSKPYQPLWSFFNATNVSFEQPDRIYAPAADNRFNNLRNGYTVVVSGAAQTVNNGVFTLRANPDVVSAGQRLRLSQQVIINESAGANVRISSDEPGAVRVAQAFQLPSGATSWTAKTVALQLLRFDPENLGIPGSVVIELCANSAGEPGTVLDSVTLNNAFINAIPENATWYRFNWSGGTTTLATGTTYWIVVRPSDAPGLGRYIAAGLTDDLSYSHALRVFVGGVWVARSVDARMPFRITGTMDSLELTRSILLQATDSVGEVIVQATGHQVWQYRDGSRTAKSEADGLLDMGSANAKPVLVRWAGVPRGLGAGRVRVVEQPNAGNDAPLLLPDGSLRAASGNEWEPGRLAAGQWVQVSGLPALTGFTNRRRALWVERSEYDARSETLTLESEGAQDPLRGVGIREG